MKIKLDVIALICILILATIFRFYDLNKPMVWVDEPIYIVGGIKLLLQDHALYNPLLWNFEHPPLGKYLIGAFALTSSTDFKSIVQLPPNYYAGLGNPDVAGAMNQALFNIRASPAVFGLFLVVVIYLLTRELYGNLSGLASAFMSAVSVNLLTFSRTAHLDIYLFFFSTTTLYLFYKFLTVGENRFSFSHKKIVLVFDKRLVYFLSTGIFLGLSLLTKTMQPIVLFPIILAIYFFYRKKASLIEIAGLFVISAVVFYIGVGDIGLYIQALQYFGGSSMLNPSKIISGLDIVYRIELPILFLFFVGLYMMIKNKPTSKDLFILVPAFLIIASVLLSSNQHYRYFVYALPFVISIASKPFVNKKMIYLGAPMLLILASIAIMWLPDYLVYTNILDQTFGRNYFWQIAGFVGFDDAAKYVEDRTTTEDLVFATNDAIRYKLVRNLLVHEGDKNTVYLTDGRFFDLQQSICPTEDILRSSNISYAVIQNPKILGEDYCKEVRDIYSTDAELTITNHGVDVMKIFRLKQ